MNLLVQFFSGHSIWVDNQSHKHRMWKKWLHDVSIMRWSFLLMSVLHLTQRIFWPFQPYQTVLYLKKCLDILQKHWRMPTTFLHLIVSCHSSFLLIIIRPQKEPLCFEPFLWKGSKLYIMIELYNSITTTTCLLRLGGIEL